MKFADIIKKSGFQALLFFIGLHTFIFTLLLGKSGYIPCFIYLYMRPAIFISKIPVSPDIQYHTRNHTPQNQQQQEKNDKFQLKHLLDKMFLSTIFYIIIRHFIPSYVKLLYGKRFRALCLIPMFSPCIDLKLL